MSIHSEKENKFISELIKNKDNKNFWIGANDHEREGQWDWSDNSRWDYSNWASGQPNGDDIQNCAHIRGDGNGKWDDTFCELKHNYICQEPTIYFNQPGNPGKGNINF